jgi:protein-tyrosine phosphatase
MKVLFVCLGNAFRSPLAEALLKKYRPDIHVDSAGINPSIPISEAAERYLAKENAQQFLKQTPESIDEKDLRSYDLIVVMEPRQREVLLNRCPECANKIIVWNIAIHIFYPKNQRKKSSEKSRAKFLSWLLLCKCI